jgi:hypothetical protein
MKGRGLRFRHAAAICTAALALAGAAAWAVAQQSSPATPAKPLAAPAKPAAAPGAAAGHAAPAKPKALDKPLWRELTPAQQAALEPLSAEWDQMDGVRKRKWLEMSNRFSSMKPEEQQRVHERMREWVKLTPAQRKLARDTYTRTKKLAPNEKTATWESYQQLPEDEKQKLAAAAAARKAAAAQQAPRPGVVLHKGSTACPAGTVKNQVSATPPCVAAQPVTAPAPAPAPAPSAATPPPSTTPAAPAVPATNAQ